MKRKVLASLLVIAVVAGLVGASTWAWFSDTETSVENEFTAGTLDLEIADNNEGWFDGTPVHASWQSPSNWAPGESFEAVVRLRNVGNIDARYLHTMLYNRSYTGANLCNVIEVVTLDEYVPGYGWLQNLPKFATQVEDYNQPLTLSELIRSYWCSGSTCDTSKRDFTTGWGYDPIPEGTPAIAAGTTYHLKLGFKFMESASNTYQGATCSFDIAFMAAQSMEQDF